MSKGSTNTILKFLIFLFIFMLIVFAFVFVFIIPQIKEYKSVKSNFSTNEIEHVDLKDRYKEFEKQLKTIEKENKKIIDTFSKKFNKSEYVSFAKKYFDDVKLTKIQTDINSSVLDVYQFNADIKAQNPKRFYNFIKELENYEGIIKINFPITIIAKESHLEISFHMSVYSMSIK